MNKENYLKEVVLTIIVTAIVLFITVPLLASANPLFSNLLQNAFKFLNLNWLWRILITDSLVIYAFRIVALLFFAYVIPRAVSITAQGIKEYGTFQAISINYLAPKIVLAGTLIVFFITQLQLYFASPELLQSLGYTNSRLTNEVFAQVTIVAFVVLLLAYLDKSRKTWNKRITYFLLLESFFLIAIAFKSVYDYSSLHGLTQKRLWGYASMIWLTGAVGAYSYHFYKKTAVNVFIKQILAFSVVVVFFINVLNFDHLIYHTAKPSTIAGIDYEYLSKLSVDAHYYNELLPKFMKEIQANSEIDESKVQPALRMIFYIEELRKKYGEKKNLNSFNIAEYQEFKATEHINVLEFRKIIEDKEEAKRLKEQSLQPTPFVTP